MMTAMAMFQPIKGMMSVNAAFKSVEDGKIDLTVPKLTYVACCCAGLALGLWKMQTMGLLPLHAADWAFYIPHKIPEELSSVPISL